MTAMLPGQLSLDDLPTAPMDADTRDRVHLVAHDWRAEEDWRKFHAACMDVSVNAEQTVDPNKVRALLTNAHGLVIESRRYSAFWNRAAGRDGFLDAVGWVTNDDTRAGNRGKPTRLYALRSPAPRTPAAGSPTEPHDVASEPTESRGAAAGEAS